MPKLTSKCGYLMDLTPIPNEYEYVLLSDKNLHKLANLLAAGRLDEDGLFDVANSESDAVIKCPRCGRIYYYEDDGIAVYEQGTWD